MTYTLSVTFKAADGYALAESVTVNEAGPPPTATASGTPGEDGTCTVTGFERTPAAPAAPPLSSIALTLSAAPAVGEAPGTVSSATAGVDIGFEGASWKDSAGEDFTVFEAGTYTLNVPLNLGFGDDAVQLNDGATATLSAGGTDIATAPITVVERQMGPMTMKSYSATFTISVVG